MQMHRMKIENNAREVRGIHVRDRCNRRMHLHDRIIARFQRRYTLGVMSAAGKCHSLLQTLKVPVATVAFVVSYLSYHTRTRINSRFKNHVSYSEHFGISEPLCVIIKQRVGYTYSMHIHFAQKKKISCFIEKKINKCDKNSFILCLKDKNMIIFESLQVSDENLMHIALLHFLFYIKQFWYKSLENINIIHVKQMGLIYI